MRQTNSNSRIDDGEWHSRRVSYFGFTIVELLVVIVLLLILAAVLLPGIMQSVEASRRMRCLNNLMQIGLALSNYESAHDVLPAGTQNTMGPIRSIESGGYHMSWATQILPYLDQQNVYHNIDFQSSIYDPSNASVRLSRIPTFLCPTDPNPTISGKAGLTNYCGIHNDFETPIDVRQNGVLFLNSSIRYEDIRDGSSQTLFVVDATSNLGWMSGTRSTLRSAVIVAPGRQNLNQGVDEGGNRKSKFQLHESANLAKTNGNRPVPFQVDRTAAPPEFVGGPSSAHDGNLFVGLMGDGSVRCLSFSIDPWTLRNLANRSDGEIEADF